MSKATLVEFFKRQSDQLQADNEKDEEQIRQDEEQIRQDEEQIRQDEEQIRQYEEQIRQNKEKIRQNKEKIRKRRFLIENNTQTIDILTETTNITEKIRTTEFTHSKLTDYDLFDENGRPIPTTTENKSYASLFRDITSRMTAVEISRYQKNYINTGVIYGMSSTETMNKVDTIVNDFGYTVNISIKLGGGENITISNR